MQLASKRTWMRVSIALAALALAAVTVPAKDIVIHLPANTSVTRKIVRYECDAVAEKIGLPTGRFSVEYIDGGGNSLVVVPISGKPLVFSNVISGSGARYAARQYIWWEAKGEATLYSDAMNGKLQSVCRPVHERRNASK